MPWIDMGNGITAHICVRGQRNRRCRFCGHLGADKLCDFPVGKGKTCDVPMCSRCATAIGPEIDHCPRHKNQTPVAEQGSLSFQEGR